MLILHAQPNKAPLIVLAVAFAGAMSALAGGYWDDAWHTERGRDEFFIAPHIAIYAGIATAGGALSTWALLAVRRHGIRAVWNHKPLALALISVAVTLASGPVDNAWHAAFGRDAVIWSPPHMLGIAGTLGLGAAILAELAGRPEAWARRLTVVAGALVLAPAAFSAVEYDTDVPQFDEVFYLPVLGFAGAIALILIRTASDARWAATASTAVHTAFIAAVGAFLALVDFPAPALPLLIPAAAVVDLAAARRWPPLVTAALYTVALHVAYVPVRNWLGDGVRFELSDVAMGGLLTFAATALLFLLAGGPAGGRTSARLVRPGTATACIGVLVALWMTPDALAHDPGQGDDADTIAMRVVAEDRRIALAGELSAAVCAETQPVGIVARRGGQTVRSSLTKTDCRLSGAVAVPERGRWFVYAQLRRDGSTVESWLPVTVGSGRATAAEDDRYAYSVPERSSSVGKVIGGIVLYVGMVALLVATFRLTGASRRQRDTRDSAMARA